MKRTHLLFLLPALTVLLAFFVLPVLRLLPASVSTDQGILLYAEILTNPRYASSLFSTVVLSLLVTIASVALGASSWRILKDVTIPALTPALFSTGALCFATSMGAFGTAFTLATDINVLPITIYTEFTLSANIAAASMLAVVLGLITWGILLAARLVSVPNER